MSTASKPASRENDAAGAFRRQPNAFTSRITADGSSGLRAEPGRYHIYVSHACPWASRAVIVRRLLGLEDAVTLSVVDPVRDERGWAFRDGPDFSHDPVNGFSFLSEAYLATDPSYDLRATVPAVWDRETERIVSNDFHTITTDLETQFQRFAQRDIDLYPSALRDDIDEINEFVYENVNDGVYRAGFATSQGAYEDAFDSLFTGLDELEGRLANTRYLVGDHLTEADIRLFTTLVRFDLVYHYHFKCNLHRLVEYPNLWGYARDLFQTPGIGETVNFDHIKRHYYTTHPHINPTRVVPKGPVIDWNEPHGRGGY